MNEVVERPAPSIPRVGEFYKVSFNQFYEAIRSAPYDLAAVDRETIQDLYDHIGLPERATGGSAGFDFKAPFGFILQPGESIKLPTGIRVKIEPGWWLGCLPRSGLGFKYRCQLDNTMGVIDSDYFTADNEGHIFAKITNDSKNSISFSVLQGEKFMQGIFIPYGITYSDNAESIRTGGFGSTGK